MNWKEIPLSANDRNCDFTGIAKLSSKDSLITNQMMIFIVDHLYFGVKF
jgi:hypothetical protein